uniref:RE13111p n=1 Tax=Drosophila melanogaster TaxID=7227 RepID=Q500Y1_DROME|nr:RE13111p [Drosophila melanogaster]
MMKKCQKIEKRWDKHEMCLWCYYCYRNCKSILFYLKSFPNCQMIIQDMNQIKLSYLNITMDDTLFMHIQSTASCICLVLEPGASSRATSPKKTVCKKIVWRYGSCY